MENRDTSTFSVSPRPGRSRALTAGKASDILWDCAVDSLVLAFLVQLMGSIALGMVSGIFRDMTPSLPPGLAPKPTAEAVPSAWDFTWFQHHRFMLLFGIIFVLKAAGSLARYSPNPTHRNAVASVKWMTRRVSDGWFSLVVVNAFTAFIGVFVMQIVQRFTLTHLLWGLVLSMFQPLFHALGHLVPGGGAKVIGGLVDWFGDNQIKFTFWLLYSAAICDDLGLPNYKTLGRYLWRRYFVGRKVIPASDVQTKPTA